MRKAAEYMLIFSVAAALSAIIIFCVPWFAPVDDVGIHTIRAASYVWPINVPFPATTVFERAGSGFYQLYYLLHVPFLCLASLIMRGGVMSTEVPTMDIMVVGAKLFHVALIGALFTTIFWVTKHMYGRAAAYLSLLLLVTASEVFFVRLFILRPHTLASLLFVVFVFGIIWRRYGFVFAAAMATVLSYTVAFMLIIPAALISLIERKGTVLAVALGGLLVGVLIHPLGLEYIQYAWFAHIVSAVLAAVGMHPAAPSEFYTNVTVMVSGMWLLLIFAAIVISTMRPARLQAFLHNRQTAELLAVTVCFIPLMLLTPRGGEYFVPLYCVLCSGFLVHMFRRSKDSVHDENEKSMYVLSRVLAGASLVSVVLIYFAAYQFSVLSPDPELGFAAARCVGEGKVYSKNFGDYVHVTFANQKLYFLTGIDPMFTVVDPEYGKYAGVLFDENSTLDELLPALRLIQTDYIVTNEFGSGWKNGLDELIKDDRLQAVCLTPGSSKIFFKILLE